MSFELCDILGVGFEHKPNSKKQTIDLENKQT